MDDKMLVKDELIGRHVRIKGSTDSGLINKSGLIIDETKNTLLIKINDKQIRVAKKITIFEFEYGQRKIFVEGSRLAYRSEDRIKKAR